MLDPPFKTPTNARFGFGPSALAVKKRAKAIGEWNFTYDRSVQEWHRERESSGDGSRFSKRLPGSVIENFDEITRALLRCALRVKALRSFLVVRDKSIGYPNVASRLDFGVERQLETMLGTIGRSTQVYRRMTCFFARNALSTRAQGVSSRSVLGEGYKAVDLFRA
jgi:hypothetical protein